MNSILQKRFFFGTRPCFLNQKWRQARGLPLNPNTGGVLAESPDYSFLDGRPTPYGSRQKRRILQQRELAKQIISFTSEIDFAVERHDKICKEHANNRTNVIESKLKPKGIELLRKPKK